MAHQQFDAQKLQPPAVRVLRENAGENGFGPGEGPGVNGRGVVGRNDGRPPGRSQYPLLEHTERATPCPGRGGRSREGGRVRYGTAGGEVGELRISRPLLI